jgi:DNA-binding response OmpR family regulator
MRVLLVENDSPLGSGVVDTLCTEGLEVDWVRDRYAAVRALREKRYELLLLDLSLPRRGSFSVLASLRRRDETLPTILITVPNAVVDRIAGLEAGADDYLIKPFAADELLVRIRTARMRHTGHAAPILTAGALRLDPSRHQVWLGVKRIALSPREFVMLHELMLDPGAVLSRTELEKRLDRWGDAISGNAVDVYIHRLRKKLGRHAILTLHGAGYRMGEPI